MYSVRLEKLEQVSKTNTLSVGYWIKGVVIKEIEVGKPVFVLRTVRNNIRITGIMNTSPVTKIEPKGDGVLYLHTENSIYKLEPITQEELETVDEGEHYPTPIAELSSTL